MLIGSPSIRRRLARLATPDGRINGLAIDHRDSLLTALRAAGHDSVPKAVISGIKADVISAIGPRASAIMLDAEFGELAFQDGAIPAGCGVIMPLEAQGYEAGAAGHRTELTTDFSSRVAVTSYGADAVKVLLPFRSDDPIAHHQLRVARQARRSAHAQGLPIILEPILFRHPHESAASFASAYPDLVIAAVEAFVETQPDLLKVPFPAISASDERAVEACRRVNDACMGIDWVLLGAGVAMDEMEAQLRLSLAAGAAGFLVGRSVWAPALVPDPEQRRQAIRDRVVPAFERLVAAQP
jgi:tagatose-1,6-bisphosphate aldolase